MVLTAEKNGIIEWANSFGYGDVADFQELGNNDLLFPILIEISNQDCEDLPTAKKILRNIVEHKHLVDDLDISKVESKEDVLYQFVCLIIYAMVESKAKNEYISKIMKLSGSTQKTMMKIIQRMMQGGGGGMGKSRGVGGAEAIVRLEEELNALREEYAEASRLLKKAQEESKDWQKKYLQAGQDRDHMLSEAHEEHEKELKKLTHKLEGKKGDSAKQMNTLKDENETLRAQVHELKDAAGRVHKMTKQVEELREFKAKCKSLEEQLADAQATGSLSGDAATQKLKDDLTKLREQMKKSEQEKAEAIRKCGIAEEKRKETVEELHEIKTEREIMQVEIARLKHSGVGAGACVGGHLEEDIDILPTDTAKQELVKYKNHIGTLKSALEQVKKQYNDFHAEQSEAIKDEKVSANVKKMTELETKFLEEQQKTLDEKEKAMVASGDAVGAEAKLSEARKKHKKEIEDLKRKIEELESGGGAGDGMMSPAEAKRKDDEIAELKTRITNQYNGFRMEQQLLSSSFHEIGLRYHQLLNEYRFVLEESGRSDMLFQKKDGD